MFAPGDEVVCVDAALHPDHLRDAHHVPIYEAGLLLIREGSTYTVEGPAEKGDGIYLIGIEPPLRRGYGRGYRPSRFRKVQRRNSSLSVESFLTIKPGFEEPRRAPATPAKAPVSAQTGGGL